MKSEGEADQKLINYQGNLPSEGKSDKKDGEYKFFISDRCVRVKTTSTNNVNEKQEKGEINTEKSIKFFLPE